MVKKFLIKALVLLLCFVAVVALYMFITYEEPEEKTTLIMESATLPVVNFVVKDKKVNYLHGYTMKMEGSYMRDTLTIIDSTGTINLNIAKYDNTIVTAKYEIRTLDEQRLIEDSSITDWKTNGDEIDASIKMSTMIKDSTEYLLIVKLSTESKAEIYYYTRILKPTETDLDTHLTFIEYFSDTAMNKEKAKELSKYREYDETKNQKNLGYVDIYCTQDQLAWGKLDVEKVTTPYITIKEMYSEFGEYTLQYVARATNNYDTYQYYNVTEYFRLRKGTQEMYIYSYERTVDQIFEANSQNISSTRINMGIDSDMKLEHLTSGNGTYACFVRERNLWCMNLASNKAVNIFTFASQKYSDVRENYDGHGIDIISVDNKGNVVFIVYGYMNEGKHEGMNGVSIFKYDNDSNAVTELLFIASTKPYSILKETAGKLTYVTDKDVVYIMLEDSIYSISLKSNESLQLVRGLDEGNYMINDRNTIIAWHVNGTLYNANQIRVLNFETGDDYSISAGEDELLKILGFVGSDLVYGTAKKTDVTTDAAGYVKFPMYRITININADKSKDQKYEKENIYIDSIDIVNNMIKLKRLTRANGVFTDAEEDQFINAKYTSANSAKLDTISTDLKKTELIFLYDYTITTTNSLKQNYPDKVEFGSTEGIPIINPPEHDTKYYVYARGRMYGRYDTAARAIDGAHSMYGLVVDGRGKFVWGRVLRSNSNSLDRLEFKKVEGDSNLMSALRTILYYNGTDTSALTADTTAVSALNMIQDAVAVDFSGADLQNSVYYVYNNQPVLTKMNNEYFLIVGYSGTAASIDKMTLMSMYDGAKETYTTKELVTKLAENDTILISLAK